MGTRPELFQLSSLWHACTRRADVQIELAVADGLVDTLPDFALPPPRWQFADNHRGSPATALADTLSTLDAAWSVATPDCVVIQGSSPLAFAAALVASTRQLPVIQVNPLGTADSKSLTTLSSFQRRSTSWLAAMHCVPTRQAAQQLIAAGHPRHTVYITGHAAVDTWRACLATGQQRESAYRDRHAWLLKRPYVVCDLAESPQTDMPQDVVWSTINRLAVCHPELPFVVIPPREMPEQHRPVFSAMNLQWISTTSLAEQAWLKVHSRLIVSNSEFGREEELAFGVPVISWDSHSTSDAHARMLETCAEELAQPPLPKHRGSDSDGRAAQRIIDLLAARAWNEPMTVRRAA